MPSASSGSCARAPRQRGVDVGPFGSGEGEMLGLPVAAHTRRRGLGCGREPRGVRGEGAVGQSRVGHRFEGEGADAVEQPVANGRRRTIAVDDDQRPAREPTDHVDAGGGGHVERLEDELDRGQGCATGEGRERPQPSLIVGEQQLVAPPDRRLQLSATLGPAAGRVAQHGEAIVEAAGISSIDKVLVRAAASSIARGRPSSDSHRSRIASSASLDGAMRASGAGSPGEQLDGVGECERGELEHGPRRRRRAAPGWCTGSGARERDR